ncbi:MAG: hypothetical protein ACO1TE_10270 [Prosthecobacter sp.]
MKTDWHELIQRYAAGTATESEAAALQQALKADADLRATYLDHMNLDVALEAVADAEELLAEARPLEKSPQQPHGGAWVQWRPLTAAAAGVVLGMFGTSMVWSYVVPHTAKRVALLREGFESGMARTAPGLPKEAGVWSGDEAEVVPAPADFKAKTGACMLRFTHATHVGENASKSSWGDVYRLVDLGSPAGENSDSLRLVANFASAPFPASEEYLCSVELCAVEEGAWPTPPPENLPWYRENASSVAARKMPLKGDGAWLPINVVMPLPPQARFVLVHVAVMRSKPATSAAPVQFRRHYVDDVKLEIVSPSAMRRHD